MPSDKLIPSAETELQMELFASETRFADIRWFFVIDTDFKHIADNMYFVGYDQHGTIICQWDVPLEYRSVKLGLVESEKPKAVELPKASITVKKQHNEITNSKEDKFSGND